MISALTVVTEQPGAQAKSEHCSVPGT